MLEIYTKTVGIQSVGNKTQVLVHLVAFICYINSHFWVRISINLISTKPQAAMAVVFSSPPTTTTSSSLNPNAPLFVPMSFRTVEDFSDQWWHLVHSSPCFRHYWLRECFQDPQALHDDFLDDQLLFQLYSQNALEEEEEEEAGKYHRALVTMGALKWRRDSGLAEPPRYAPKVPKIAKARMISPRTIQQPR